MFDRLIKPIENRSFFLFGARGTGKSTWLHKAFEARPHLYIDLLDLDQEERLAKNPAALSTEIDGMKDPDAWVLIDEIQKLPKLLDTVHRYIEKDPPVRFALTGSSTRKLKRGAANLLAGRAFLQYLFPLTFLELKEDFELSQAISWGTLPEIFQLNSDQDKTRYLRTYAQTYLKEEIVAEQVIRKLDPFRHFLEIAAQQNGEILNYSNIARDIGVDTITVQSYFQILEDTLVGYFLHPYHESIRKRQRSNPKFYFFDLGVKRSLENMLTVELRENTYAYSKAFEHLVILEAMRLNAYFERDYRFSYLRTKDHAEIDLIVERPGAPLALVEIKSGTQADERDIKTLAALLKDMKQPAEAYCLSRDPTPKRIGEIRLLPWQEGLREILRASYA
ncbi:MAG: ATP-binding protein [Deltaproteobacteria bacterium]|nr:ATP-binding protein [Deltaproteobacteria bacterium]